MSAKHTPGPWEFQFEENGDYDQDGSWNPCPREAEALANARLIAASPEMAGIVIDAEEILAVVLEDREEEMGEEDDVLRDLLARVRAVKAKIEGNAVGTSPSNASNIDQRDPG